MENFTPPQVSRVKDITIDLRCQIFETSASGAVEFMKFLAAHRLRQKFFVVSVDVAENRTPGINFAEIVRRQMFADAVAAIQVVRKICASNIFATRAATVAIKQNLHL